MNRPEPHESFILEEGVEKITSEADTKVLSAVTFTIQKEDHTLGNLLRAELLKEKQVVFSGYKMPHPLEYNLVLRVQTHHENFTPLGALKNSINKLLEEINIIEEKFNSEVERKNEGSGMYY